MAASWILLVRKESFIDENFTSARLLLWGSIHAPSKEKQTFISQKTRLLPWMPDYIDFTDKKYKKMPSRYLGTRAKMGNQIYTTIKYYCCFKIYHLFLFFKLRKLLSQNLSPVVLVEESAWETGTRELLNKIEISLKDAKMTQRKEGSGKKLPLT